MRSEKPSKRKVLLGRLGWREGAGRKLRSGAVVTEAGAGRRQASGDVGGLGPLGPNNYSLPAKLRPVDVAYGSGARRHRLARAADIGAVMGAFQRAAAGATLHLEAAE